MAKEYEFSYQSPKQKFILIGVKLLVASFIAMNLYSLAWQAEGIELGHKLANIGSILVAFWIYSNLCRVKTEIQELFVEPIDNSHMAEVMLVGGLFMMTDLGLVIYNIFRLNNWL